LQRVANHAQCIENIDPIILAILNYLKSLLPWRISHPTHNN
jgi:hypothetical protein